MEIRWTQKAQDDLERIYRFACQYSRQHAGEYRNEHTQITAVYLGR